MILQNGFPQARAASGSPPPTAPPKEKVVDPDYERPLDRYNASRNVGNYLSGAALGAVTETAFTTLQSPLLAYEIVENVWQAETIGPNLKVLGTLAAIPAAALSIPVAPIVGLVRGSVATSEAIYDDDRQPRELARNSSPGATAEMFTRTDGGPITFTGGLIESLEKLGEAELGEGQTPYDIPILSPAFAVIGGACSGVISGAVGLVSGVLAGGLTTVKEMVRSVTESDQTAGERVTRFLFSPLNLVVMGPALAWNGVKESVPRGLSDGWTHGPIKPIWDTARASLALGAGAIKEAWER